ncbi:hypothetical protein KCU62_g207, partial [Aureobasidium sp. EXF-3399]
MVASARTVERIVRRKTAQCPETFDNAFRENDATEDSWLADFPQDSSFSVVMREAERLDHTKTVIDEFGDAENGHCREVKTAQCASSEKGKDDSVTGTQSLHLLDAILVIILVVLLIGLMLKFCILDGFCC